MTYFNTYVINYNPPPSIGRLYVCVYVYTHNVYIPNMYNIYNMYKCIQLLITVFNCTNK